MEIIRKHIDELGTSNTLDECNVLVETNGIAKRIDKAALLNTISTGIGIETISATIVDNAKSYTNICADTLTANIDTTKNNILTVINNISTTLLTTNIADLTSRVLTTENILAYDTGVTEYNTYTINNVDLSTDEYTCNVLYENDDGTFPLTHLSVKFSLSNANDTLSTAINTVSSDLSTLQNSFSNINNVINSTNDNTLNYTKLLQSAIYKYLNLQDIKLNTDDADISTYIVTYTIGGEDINEVKISCSTDLQNKLLSCAQTVLTSTNTISTDIKNALLNDTEFIDGIATKISTDIKNALLDDTEFIAGIATKISE